MPSMATCRLELMGLPNAHAYQRWAGSILPRGSHLLSGINIPNKKPGEPLLDWARVLQEAACSTDLCVHYSLKHQRGQGHPVAAFQRFCWQAVEAGVSRVLLVTGPRGPTLDAVAVLEQLVNQHPAPGQLRLGVAFNACLPTEGAREIERNRLIRKLMTGLIEDVWLNCGSDVALLGEGAAFIHRAAKESARAELKVFGSVLLPNEAQLQQMRERPWNGVHFSDEYLASLDGMARVTGNVLEVFKGASVEPIVESKVRTDSDLSKLQQLLRVQEGTTVAIHKVPCHERPVQRWRRRQSLQQQWQEQEKGQEQEQRRQSLYSKFSQ